MGKGSGRRPGIGFEANWEAIFGGSSTKPTEASQEPKPTYEELEATVARLKAELKRLQEEAVWDRM